MLALIVALLLFLGSVQDKVFYDCGDVASTCVTWDDDGWVKINEDGTRDKIQEPIDGGINRDGKQVWILR